MGSRCHPWHQSLYIPFRWGELPQPRNDTVGRDERSGLALMLFLCPWTSKYFECPGGMVVWEGLMQTTSILNRSPHGDICIVVARSNHIYRFSDLCEIIPAVSRVWNLSILFQFRRAAISGLTVVSASLMCGRLAATFGGICNLCVIHVCHSHSVNEWFYQWCGCAGEFCK